MKKDLVTEGVTAQIIDALVRERRPDLVDESGRINQNAIARETRLNQTSVRKVLLGITLEPTNSTLEAFGRMLGATVPELRGQAQIAGIDDHLSKTIEKGKQSSETLFNILKNTRQVPLYDWKELCVYYTSNRDINCSITDKDYQLIEITQLASDIENYFLVTAPAELRSFLNNADKLLFEKDLIPKPGKFVLCDINGELDIRVFKRITSDGKQYKLSSPIDGVSDEYDDENKSNIIGVLKKGIFNAIDF